MDLSRIRLRLAGWNLLVLGLVLAITIGTAVIGQVQAGVRAVDDALRAGAARAAVRLEHDRHRDHDHRERGEHAEPDEDDLPGASAALLVITVRAGEDAIRVNRHAMPPGLPDREALDAALDGREAFSERASAGEPLRLYTVPVFHEGRLLGAVQVGRAMGESRRALARSVLVLVITGAAGLILAAAGSAFLSNRAMRPIGEALDRQRRFIADASHELRTPVAVLRARAELLQREGEALPAAAREEIGRLHRDAEELAALLTELLDLARLDAAEETIALAPVALDEVVDELAAQLAPLAAERGVALSTHTEPVWAQTNLGRIRQVLRALADNALKHTPAGGTIVLEVAEEGDRARLRVRDDGEGIAAEHLPHVFDRFYRADEARGRGGAGLGLAIAGELVRRMRGEISMESAYGHGTTVTAELPLAARPA
ncbi:MAG: HAMP domain-containing sensor histidine kinase [Minicystis sp.]